MRILLIVAMSIGALIASAPQALAAPPPWYPPMRWQPADPENYEEGRVGAAISGIVIHATDGRYAGTLSWFRDPRAKVSAHYVIRASDGQVTQMVAEKDTAFHARGSNRGAIGIEHEFDPRSGVGFTDAQYRSSATLVCAIARRYGFPADRAHIVGHSEVARTDHSDPGPSWDWSRYMRLVSACAVAAGGGGAASTAVDGCACVPAPDLTYGSTGASVALLQWQLAYLGWLPDSAVIEGGGQFGPRTLAAIRAFQAASGVPATGTYGPLTAGALARSLASVPTRAAPPGLATGSRSSDVATLQRDLARLGYIGMVTGYFGPLTESAVRRFQADHGIDRTGTYGPLTRAAMAAHLRR